MCITLNCDWLQEDFSKELSETDSRIKLVQQFSIDPATRQEVKWFRPVSVKLACTCVFSARKRRARDHFCEPRHGLREGINIYSTSPLIFSLFRFWNAGSWLLYQGHDSRGQGSRLQGCFGLYLSMGYSVYSKGMATFPVHFMEGKVLIKQVV